ncbi:hypothetical protein AGOR_G00173690 [Albula goreensis]|uniref:Mif2/CENP-C cupin domain-containing protein n=1 Tax=Albula goreensis TaxID=1534307 RepID=A0A8T3CXA2_9TELE|nr:hypothetical protein AGOR_G00173690 [Albula goreensis]
MCNNELHSSGTNRRKKANKTPPAPAPVLSPAAEDDVPLEGTRKRSKRVSNQSSGKMTQISKRKSQSTRHNQKSKKTVPEFPSLPEESEGNGNDFSGVDDGYSEPSPNPDQHYSPTPGHDSQRVFDDACTRHKLNRRLDQQRLSTHRRLQSHSVSPSPDRQQRTVYAYGESEVFDESSPPSDKLTAEGLPKQRKRPKSSQRTFKKGTDGLTSENHKEKSLQSFIKRNHSLAPKNIKTTLASFGAIFTPVSTAAKRSASRRPLNYPSTLSPQGDHSGVSKRSSAVFNGYQHGSDYPTNEPIANFVSSKAIADICPNCPRAVHGKRSGTVPLTMDSARIPQFDELQSEVDRCKGFESGPSSMIELEKSLPSCQSIPHALSGRQMCGPPLRPITLQVEDREDLVKWLSNVWTTPDGAQIITPEHFQWYAYRGRAMGFRTDMIYETFSNGKILLGSYMTKPLQVDNNAILVFNILTSLVCITINGVKTDLTCGETFVVPCGHAYGMRNLTAEPAVLFYHRMVAEPSDLGD